MHYKTDIVFITKLERNDNQEIYYSATLFFCQLREELRRSVT